jgi:hypothetical protein
MFRQLPGYVTKRTADNAVICELREDRLINLAPDTSNQLRFASGRAGLRFTNAHRLDPQTIRQPRELTKQSASLLDEIIEMTEGRANKTVPGTISKDQLQQYRASRDVATLFGEESAGVTWIQGSVSQVLVNRYESDPKAREGVSGSALGRKAGGAATRRSCGR